MKDNEMLAKAISIAANAFIETMDKGGSPYILHCLAVMDGVSHLGHKVMAAAVLHDLLEDTEWTANDLWDAGFPEDVVWMVTVCTRKPNEDYLSYIGRMSCYPDTKAIKLADLRHNMRPDRLPDLSDKTMERMRKYHTAYQFILKEK